MVGQSFVFIRCIWRNPLFAFNCSKTASCSIGRLLLYFQSLFACQQFTHLTFVCIQPVIDFYLSVASDFMTLPPQRTLLTILCPIDQKTATTLLFMRCFYTLYALYISHKVYKYCFVAVPLNQRISLLGIVQTGRNIMVIYESGFISVRYR